MRVSIAEYVENGHKKHCFGGFTMPLSLHLALAMIAAGSMHAEVQDVEKGWRPFARRAAGRTRRTIVSITAIPTEFVWLNTSCAADAGHT